MGLFKRALSSAGNLVKNIAFIAAVTLINVVQETVQTVKAITTEYRRYQQQNKSFDVVRENKLVKIEVEAVNDEASELEEKQAQDGQLNEYEQYRLDELYEKRNKLRDRFGENREVITAQNIANEVGEYKNILVQDTNSQILQFHLGQTVFGKRCSCCGKPMNLQFARGKYSVKMNEFFWSCVGYYDTSCNHGESFTQADINLFTRVDREEFSMSSQQLGDILLMPGIADDIRRRMSKIKSHATDIYLCPTHCEPLVLREKRNNVQGLLDQYFLGCPRWKPGNAGCNYLVKLKSVAQLASVLEAFYGRGIL